jgi:cytochrome c oxidase assembly protein subunit 15
MTELEVSGCRGGRIDIVHLGSAECFDPFSPSARFRRTVLEPSMTPDSTTAPRSSLRHTVNRRGYRPAPFWIALLCVVFTWPLLFVGGLVTTYRVGMAVPDWPTTFGINMFLFDMRNVAWGVFVEHGHRLYGAAVGVCTILLMLDFFLFDRRKSVKTLGVLALIAVILQGVLGGLRVNQNSTLLAMVHGCTGQAFFAFMAILATITARSWFVDRQPVSRLSGLKILCGAMLAVAYLQIILGAWLRHFASFGTLMSHAGFALIVIGLALAVVWTIRRRSDELPGLLGPVRLLEITLAFQMILGVAAWWLLRPFDGMPRSVDTIQALIRTGHQANAALLLASVTVLVIRVYGAAAGVPRVSESESEMTPSFRGLEVIA